MRILILPSWYPTPARPVNGIFIREQANALAAVHTVRVLYLDVLPRGHNEKARSYSTTEHGYVEETIEVPNRLFIWQFSYLLAMLRALRRLNRTFSPDVIHCHIAVPAGWAAVALRRIANVPLVLTEHSSEFDSWRKRPGLRLMARRAFAGIDVVIAVSEGQRRRVERVFGRTKRLLLVPNIVDTSRFKPSPFPDTAGGYRLLFVGLMDTDQKGVHVLLEALSRIKQSGVLDRPLHVDLVGDGVLRPGYEEQARALGVDDMLTCHGLQPHDVVARMMRENHALVLPSLHEALPLVIIEALASGRPVIATSCGGPEFMLDAGNGLVVEPGQPGPLVDAIVDLLTHLERYDPGSIASAAASKYSYSAVEGALSRIYSRLVERKQEKSGR